MGATLYGERNGIRARFQSHPQSSEQDLRVALKLAEQQQRLLRGGQTTWRNHADIKDKIYTISRHNVNGARSRHHPSPDPRPRQKFQDDGINRLDRRYSFSSEDGKQEALLAPAPVVDMVPSSYHSTTTIPNVISPPSQQYKPLPRDEKRRNMLPILSPKEQRKADKRARKELEEKAKQARKMVKADIKDKAKKSRKRLKATYKVASSNPEDFVAWAEAYQKLAIFPGEGPGIATDSANETRPQTSMQWLKALLPKRLAGKTKSPVYTAMPTPTIAELPADERKRAELGEYQSVSVSRSRRPEYQAAAPSKGKAKAVDAAEGESSEQIPWTMQPPGTARIHHLPDFSLPDSSLSENESKVKTAPTSTSETPFSEAGSTETIAQYLTREKDFLRDEIGRLGAQAAAKLRQCATEMEQAEGLRNADLKRALSEQHRRHAQELEKFTAALNTLHNQGRKELPKAAAGGHKEHDPNEEVLKNGEHVVARREHDLALQLREASLREKEVVLQERDAASREREAASRERQAASLVAGALSQEQRAILQGWSPLPEDQLPSLLNPVTSPLMREKIAREPDPRPKIDNFLTRFSKNGRARAAGDASTTPHASPRPLLDDLPLRVAPNTPGRSPPRRGVDSKTSFDHQELRALRQLTRMFVDQFITGLLPLRSAGFRSHAVPKRKSPSTATFTKSSGESRPRSAPSTRRRVGKGKGKELSEDEGDSDAEPRKRRRQNPSVWNPRQRILACPYSKYDICRYSEMNVMEKGYRGCTSCYLTDISRLKQHLYRVHRRPENYCPRCFEVFESEILLDEHARQLISCKVAECPFPERLTDGQVKELKKKWTGKSTEQCWYIIFKILFPDAPKPPSPYAEDKSSVIVQIDAQNAPQLLSGLFRERLSQLERTPMMAQLWLAEVQTLLSQTVEYSMQELLRRSTHSNLSGSAPGSASSRDPVSSPVQGLESYQSNPSSPNESLPSLLDLDLGIADFDNSTFENFAGPGNGQLDDPHNRPSEFNWSETLDSRRAEGDVSPMSQWHPDQPGLPLIADIASDAAFGNTQAVQTTYESHNSASLHQISVCSPSPEPFLPESPSHITVPKASGSMDPPPSQTMQSSQLPAAAAKPLQTNRSQRSLDSGYGSILTAQQSHMSANNSTENLIHSDTGFYDTLAKPWVPVGADEEAFCERARSSARTSYFSESRTVDYPSVTY